MISNDQHKPSEPPLHETDIDVLVRQHLSVDDVLHEDAYRVVQGWYAYFNARSVAITGQITTPGKIGVDMMEASLEIPITGFTGNLFWQNYHSQIMPMIELELCRSTLMRAFAESMPEYSYSLQVGQYAFIGFVISLVQPNGIDAWRNFEMEFRPIINAMCDKVMQEAGNGG